MHSTVEAFSQKTQPAPIIPFLRNSAPKEDWDDFNPELATLHLEMKATRLLEVY